MRERACQQAAATTSGALRLHNLSEPPSIRGESAYPGLQALIADFYGSLREGGGESPAADILGIARIADSVREWRRKDA